MGSLVARLAGGAQAFVEWPVPLPCRHVSASHLACAGIWQGREDSAAESVALSCLLLTQCLQETCGQGWGLVLELWDRAL